MIIEESAERVDPYDLIVVGSGFTGLVAARVVEAQGGRVVVLEKSEFIGGASAASGGQVWVPANHLMASVGMNDTPAEGLEYIASGAGSDVGFDEPLAAQWLEAAREAAVWLEEDGAVSWAQIPDYPDYRYPEAPGSKPTGRYLTSARITGSLAEDGTSPLQPSRHFPIGITYGEAAAIGRSDAGHAQFAALLAERRQQRQLTHGQGLVEALRSAVRSAAEVSTEVTELLLDNGRVIGVRAEGPRGSAEYFGPVLLATGAHDYDVTHLPGGLDESDAGSLAPPTLTGDAIRLGLAAGAEAVAMPGRADVRVPGYRLPAEEWPGDNRMRGCWEQSLPHSFIVDATGRRFCDDSHRPAIAAAVLANPERHTPMFLIWDSEHRRRYGMGSTPPGGEYPEGLAFRADTLAELAEAIGVDGLQLQATAERFNSHAARGEDSDFGRGDNAMGRAIRGDRSHPVHPNVAPVSVPPFYGMKLHLVSTGISNVGLRVGLHGRVLNSGGVAVEGLYAAGAAAGRTMFGTGYNSGYSLSQGMGLAYMAAQHATGHASL